VSTRSLRGLVAAAALLLVALCGWYYLEGTPQYSLYRFGAAVHDRDAAAAERFVDVDRVAAAASEVIVSDYVAGNPKVGQELGALGPGVVRGAGQVVKSLVAARLRGEIRKMAESGGQGPAVLALPVGVYAVFREAGVTREGTEAWVTYPEPRGGQTRFRMTQRPNRWWRITEFDREWVRRHLKDAPAG
jgi:hypothetical protein